MSKGKKEAPPPSPTPIIQAVNTPSVTEKALEDRMKKWTDWRNQLGPKDITTAPGMGEMLDIYGSAESLANQRNMSNPAIALSGPSHRGYAAQIDKLGRSERFTERAAGLSRAFGNLDAQNTGLGISAAEMEAARKQQYAQLSLANSQAYYNRPQKKSLWEKIAGVAVGGLGAAASFI